jgi:hypothetical protein
MTSYDKQIRKKGQKNYNTMDSQVTKQNINFDFLLQQSYHARDNDKNASIQKRALNEYSEKYV